MYVKHPLMATHIAQLLKKNGAKTPGKAMEKDIKHGISAPTGACQVATSFIRR